VVAGIEQVYGLKTLVFDEAVGCLKAFKERTRWGSSGAPSESGQVLLTQAEWEARQRGVGGESSGKTKRGEGGGRGHGRGHGGGRSGCGGGDARHDGTVKRDKSHIKCFKCHKYGHYANRCPGEKKDEAHKGGEKEPTVLLVEVVLPDQL
jgi:hypothetical protein